MQNTLKIEESVFLCPGKPWSITGSLCHSTEGIIKDGWVGSQKDEDLVSVSIIAYLLANPLSEYEGGGADTVATEIMMKSVILWAHVG